MMLAVVWDVLAAKKEGGCILGCCCGILGLLNRSAHPDSFEVGHLIQVHACLCETAVSDKRKQ